MTAEETEIYTNLMYDSFKNDPGVCAQLSFLEKSDEILKAQCRGEIEAFDRAGMLTTVDGGFMIAFPSSFAESNEYITVLQEISGHIISLVNAEEITAMQNISIKALSISKPDWYKKYVNSAYILQVIAVSPKMRGKGIFRKLITPLIEKSETEKIPIALQTHNPDNLKIYEHFGFKIMESLYSDELKITCYNLLRE